MRRWLSFSIVLSLVAPSVAATAQEVDQAQESEAEFKRLTTEAGQMFDAGDYEGAAAAFLAAYELKPVSNILYNVGRIYEKAGRLDLALEHFERFVKSPNVEQEARRDAIDRIKTIQEVLALDAPKDDTTQATTQPEPEPEPVVQASEPDHTLAWVLMGAGGLTLIGSGVTAFLASGAHDDFENATSVQARRDAASSGETFSLVADSLLITGVVLGGIGAVLYFTADSNEPQASLKIAPTVGKKSVGLGLELTY